MAENGDKKDKVLHTRVPQSLDQELKKKAGSLGLSVSSLVRNILANTFGLVEDIVVDSANIARAARGEKPGESPQPALSSPPADRILGWQEAILNLNAVCQTCNALLPKGSRAGIGVTEGTAAKPILCESCLEELIHDEPES